MLAGDFELLGLRQHPLNLLFSNMYASAWLQNGQDATWDEEVQGSGDVSQLVLQERVGPSAWLRNRQDATWVVKDWGCQPMIV